MSTFSIIAVIIFLISLTIEGYICTRDQIENSFELRDVGNNIFLGVLTFVFKMIFIKGSVLAVFVFFHQYAIFDIGYQWWAWILLIFLNDFLFYWFHRWSHEIRILWASHSVHHSSEVMNFSTSIRGVFIIMLYRFIMWFPLAWIGFDPEHIIIVDALAFFYQFPIHTRTMKSWGFLEYFLNSPSHHRVHHGSNPKYLDKNYGAVFIIWDRMFGTFQKEEEEVVFGLTTSIDTQNPIKIAFYEWIAMLRDILHAKSWSDAMHFMFDRPGWKKEYEDKKTEKKEPKRSLNV